ncbi:cation:proton antiporter [bacterium]|nr:cation:proton antiporter [bacterium]
MVSLIYQISAGLIILSLLLTLFRLFKGPTVADRIVALDAMTIISISLIVLIAHIAQRIIYLDVAIVYGLVSFIGVVAFARYLERGL